MESVVLAGGHGRDSERQNDSDRQRTNLNGLLHVTTPQSAFCFECRRPASGAPAIGPGKFKLVSICWEGKASAEPYYWVQKAAQQELRPQNQCGFTAIEINNVARNAKM
jgi:hypothetical protein